MRDKRCFLSSEDTLGMYDCCRFDVGDFFAGALGGELTIRQVNLASSHLPAPTYCI
jgi:hypothetical protein